MKSAPKIKLNGFLKYELLNFYRHKVFLIIFAIALISGILLVCREGKLLEIEKSIYGGIVSSFIFYVLIELIPQSINRRNEILRVSNELSKCLFYLNNLFENVKIEYPNVSTSLSTPQRYYGLLRRQSIGNIPQTQGLRRVLSTSNTHPITFVFSPLGQVLYGEFVRTKDLISILNLVASSTNTASWYLELPLEIKKLMDKEFSLPVIQRLGHVGNTAAVLGTDFDFLFDQLSVIQTRLKNEFHVIF